MTLLERLDALLGSSRTILDIARNGGDAKALVITLREHIQTLREELLETREAVTTLLEEKREVEKQLAKALEFQMEREDYTLVTLSTGSVVCTLKQPASGEQQGPMYFCARCFEKGSREILEVKHTDFNRDTYNCPACGSTALIPNDRKMEVYTVPTRNSPRGF
ncbi:hypothetical protein [Billgrantia gudaonensis]|uniref:Uncharacterized protein n=1 Tax=Billgrantia gudaonensis TaxID=376427 RepID=A0A1G9ATT0_9GAMM|nr:hypothetical protein [Halomonas gudaonensis]SDK30681.1 hypothetical protein SAMN04487954_11489 [Halomonas gudaonensis]